ncbi:MAG: 16S rRNA pseudouridine(516) synthase [Betaproteobacteria bacterium]
MPKLSLDRILQSQGFGTRNNCRQLIRQGDVRVDGVVVDDERTVFETTHLQLSIFEEIWQYREHVYIALNKPGDIECSRRPSHHPSVMTLLPDVFRQREVQAIGRLDHDTTGLLLLTDDGAFNHRMSSPKHHVPKRYLATTAAPITAELIETLRNGVQLHDEPAPIAAVECVQVAELQLEIVLAQGKYHQVKRMLAAAGNHCAALQRISIGELRLASLALAEGDWCYLEDEQLALLK